MTELIEEQQTGHILEYEENNDPEWRTHIINPPMNNHIWRFGMTARDVVDIARIRGVELVALCGFKFVPKHDPENYDACKPCMDAAGIIMKEMG